MASGRTAKLIGVEDRGAVRVLTMSRPEARNALSPELLVQLADSLRQCDADAGVRVIVLTGGASVFSAGADISALEGLTGPTYPDSLNRHAFDTIRATRKPVVAAVAGYCLGGGCEIALMCDIIIAADSAKFGQPEIKLGVIPGIGGSQRLTRAVGKAKAMEMCLTGRNMDAEEAERAGLVSRVVPAADLLDDALKTATTIAEMSMPIAMMAKEAVNRSFETTLNEGIRFERRVFHSAFATEDQSEGMAAFVEKRTPDFKHR